METTNNNTVDGGMMAAASYSFSAPRPLCRREQERLRSALARRELERRREEHDLRKQLMEIWEEYVQRRQNAPSECISQLNYGDLK